MATVTINQAGNRDDIAASYEGCTGNVAIWGDGPNPNSTTQTYLTVFDWNFKGTHYLWETTLIFDGVTLPAGATIIDATLTFNVYSSSTAKAIIINAIDEDDPSSLKTYAQYAAANITTAEVGWTIPSQSDGDNVNRTSGNIKDIIQELVDRGGWASGQAMQLVLRNASAQIHDSECAYAGGNILYINFDDVSNISLYVEYQTYEDSGLRVYDGSAVKKIAALTLEGTHQARFYDGSAIKGIPLVDPAAGDAIAKLRVYDGSNVKCFAEYT